MNFMAYAYWTDGWRDHSLMPNDEGLRQCQCGRIVLQRELVEIDTAEASDLPCVPNVSDKDLSIAIANAPSAEVEIAARLEYWRYLNHGYRGIYRTHRALEDARTKANAPELEPDNRSWWDKLLRRLPPAIHQMPESPFTFPPFNPTNEQVENMNYLCRLLESVRKEDPQRYSYELAELYREQGVFDPAEEIIRSLDDGASQVTHRVLTALIQDRVTAPVRYKI